MSFDWETSTPTECSVGVCADAPTAEQRLIAEMREIGATIGKIVARPIFLTSPYSVRPYATVEIRDGQVAVRRSRDG